MELFLALLVSADSGALTVTQKILEEYGVSVKVVGSALAAVPLIKTTKLIWAFLIMTSRSAESCFGAGDER